MSRNDKPGYETAVSMYQREHDRWNQWALFFFGSIGSVFVLWGQLHEVVPLCVPALLATILSVMWIGAALSIRASTRAWLETVKELENDGTCGDRVFHVFERHLENRRRWEDLRQCLQLWRGEPYKRVTRTMVLLGLLSALSFFVLFWFGVFCSPL